MDGGSTLARLYALRQMLDEVADLRDPDEKATRMSELRRFLDIAIRIEERQSSDGVGEKEKERARSG